MKLKSLINKKYLIENTDDAEEFVIPGHSKETKEKQALARAIRILKQKHNKGSLSLRDIHIESLGNLETIDGGLDLVGTLIKSLDNLKSVGDYLYLEGTKILSLGKLQSVGGYLDISKTWPWS